MKLGESAFLVFVHLGSLYRDIDTIGLSVHSHEVQPNQLLGVLGDEMNERLEQQWQKTPRSHQAQARAFWKADCVSDGREEAILL